MTSKERVITALKRQPHDRVPWIEGVVGNKLASIVCGESINVDWAVASDGITPVQAGAELAKGQKKINKVFGKDNINFNAFAPIFAHRKKFADGSSVVGEGIIKTRNDFKKYFNLPAVDDKTFVKSAKEFIACKEDYCSIAAIRLGIGATLISMGIEGFSYAMADDVELIKEIHESYANWTKGIIPMLEEIGFDCFWAFDDIAFNPGPIFPISFYEKEILPAEKEITKTFSVPFITHSDGNMMPLLGLWVKLGQNAIHPIQADVMDIYKVREKLPEDTAIVGNIDMNLLVNGTPSEIDALIKERMEKLKPSNNYLISSSNSLTDDMKPENIKAMIGAIDKYGWY